ncbi:MAG TPA: lipoprotein, partial [Spirochaetota bacterium]|nr:lipoprotein [Spirochaetota bacterium]
MQKYLSILLFTAALTGCSSMQSGKKTTYENAGPPYGRLELIDQIFPAEDTNHAFKESKPGISKIKTILQRKCRVIENKHDQGHYFAYLIAKNKGLKAGRAYLLSVEYPEDKPRRMLMINRGGEVQEALYTGEALGDDMYNFTQNNVASYDVPLSGKYEKFQTVFFLNDRFAGAVMPRDGDKNVNERPYGPRDGFWVVIGQNKHRRAPLAKGCAVHRIALYAIPDIADISPVIHHPPMDLPRRYIFTREEMSDSVNFSGWRKDKTSSLDHELALYTNKARLMRFLGINTMCYDLLEFGHNQGFPTAKDWFVPNDHPDRWADIIKIATAHKLFILPYYEYAGSTADLGPERRARPLGDQEYYTHLKWVEKNNTDLTDPDTLAEIKQLIDVTIGRYINKGIFIGACLRNRLAQMPVSFSPDTVQRYQKDTGRKVTRKKLQQNKKNRQLYYKWWFKKRAAFTEAIGQYLTKYIQGTDPVLLYIPWNSEPGPAVSLDHKRQFPVADLSRWQQILAGPEHEADKFTLYQYNDFLEQDIYIKALTNVPSTWGEHEMHHAEPRLDPENYQNARHTILAYPFHRAYSVAKPKYFTMFRSKAGMAALRQYPLNEWSIGKKIGYNAFNVNRSGPYVMLAEVRAMAYGNPTHLG